MVEFFLNAHPVMQAFLATLMTYAFTMAGSALVFFFKKPKKMVLDAALSLAGGVMIAASFFSLLSPAVEKCAELGQPAWLVVSLGFLLGGVLLLITDKLSSKVLVDSSQKRNFMLMSSITIHNIPEGLVVGLAFGSLASGGIGVMGAFMLALGIGIQNFPEGSSISLPLRRSGMSRWRAFFYGQISGIVEPIAGVIGALLVLKIEGILPVALAFAAGAMLYVVTLEIIPESQAGKQKNLMAFFTLLGFILMMALDVGLG